MPLEPVDQQKVINPMETSESKSSRERRKSGIPNAVLAVLLIVAAETMFFGGLVSAYLVKVTSDSDKLPGLMVESQFNHHVLGKIEDPEDKKFILTYYKLDKKNKVYSFQKKLLRGNNTFNEKSRLIGLFKSFKASLKDIELRQHKLLPIEVTAVNTLILLVSAIAIQLVIVSIRKAERQGQAKLWLWITLLLGGLFVAIQGNEWVKLIESGLTAQSSLTGGFFYTIIGAHAFHVIVGLLVLITVIAKLSRGRYNSESFSGLLAVRIYWVFVVGLWPILYILVYDPFKLFIGVS